MRSSKRRANTATNWNRSSRIWRSRSRSGCLASSHRDAIARHFGAHVFDLWRCDVASFEPVIEADLAEQSKLEASYTELVASAKFEFRGETLTLSEIVKYDEHPDRECAARGGAAPLGMVRRTSRPSSTRSVDKLVRLRHTMAAKLGYQSYVEFAYQLMHRVDYGQSDVERFREQIPRVRRSAGDGESPAAGRAARRREVDGLGRRAARSGRQSAAARRSRLDDGPGGGDVRAVRRGT